MLKGSVSESYTLSFSLGPCSPSSSHSQDACLSTKALNSAPIRFGSHDSGSFAFQARHTMSDPSLFRRRTFVLRIAFIYLRVIGEELDKDQTSVALRFHVFLSGRTMVRSKGLMFEGTAAAMANTFHSGKIMSCKSTVTLDPHINGLIWLEGKHDCRHTRLLSP